MFEVSIKKSINLQGYTLLSDISKNTPYSGSYYGKAHK